MKRIVYCILFVLACVGATGQTLSVASIETKAGEQAVLTVNITGATGMTALQFNLSLPEGVTLAESGATMGVATSGHSLSVQPLDNGDHLFILYSMNLSRFKDGELLRVPVTAGSNEMNATARLYTVRSATADAVSHTCNEISFDVSITMPAEQLQGDVTGDGKVDAADVVALVNYILGLDTLPNAAAAYINDDDKIDIVDLALLIGLVAKQ